MSPILIKAPICNCIFVRFNRKESYNPSDHNRYTIFDLGRVLDKRIVSYKLK